MLHELIREATKSSHDASMQHPLMVAFMQGGIEPEAFYDYLGQLKRVYEILDIWGQELPIYDARLKRSEIIDQALEDVVENVHCYKETDDYVGHILELLEANDSTAVLAHHYTRFMGDLAAGPMFRFLSENVGVPEDRLEFYKFDDLGDLQEYRKTYGRQLAELIPEEEYERFIGEVLLAFTYSEKLFNALSKKWQ